MRASRPVLCSGFPGLPSRARDWRCGHRILLAIAGLCAGGGLAAQDLGPAYRLDSTQCGERLPLLRSSFESAEATASPSFGRGLATGGTADLQVAESDQTHRLYYTAPGLVEDSPPRGLVLLLHGTAGTPALALSEARQLRDRWIPAALQYGWVIGSLAASGDVGGYVVPDPAVPAIACALEYLQAGYNIDLDRVYIWGFSGGGDTAHAVALSNTEVFAAYGVNAGFLRGLSCESIYSFGNHAACNPFLNSRPRRMPASLRIGDQDSAGRVAESFADFNRFSAAGWTPDILQYGQFAGGHLVPASEPYAHSAFFVLFKRPRPDLP